MKEAASAGRLFNRVEIHTLDTDTRCASAEFERRCRRNAVAFLPRSLTRGRVVRWRRVPGGSDDFHERYLLTDRGGYRLGKGLDEETGITQPVGLLDDLAWDRLWTIYRDGTASLAKRLRFRPPLVPMRGFVARPARFAHHSHKRTRGTLSGASAGPSNFSLTD